jgi:hypothetical protein
MGLPVLSPEHQWMRLRASSICRGRGAVRRSELTWDFDARPTPLSRTYSVRLKYRKGGLPEVLVVSPDLNALAGDRRLPHVYSTKPVRLCLYYPSSQEWTSTQSIADTLVPWTYLWLAYFEDWLLTDEWKGGGKHPGEENESQT